MGKEAGVYFAGVARCSSQGRGGREEGARGKMGFYDAPFPSFHPLIPPPSRGAQGARFYDSHDESRGGAYVYHDDTGKTSEKGEMKGRRDGFRIVPMDPCPMLPWSLHGARSLADSRGHASRGSDGSSRNRRAPARF